MTTALLAALMALGAPAQDEKFKPDREEKELTPEEAMRLLKEAQELMLRTEELLNDSSRGKALETEAELLRKLEELSKDNPKVLELIRRMIQKTEKKQEDTLKKLEDIIRRAKSSSSSSSSQQQQDPKNQKPKDGRQQKPKNGDQNAQNPYDPNRTDPPSKFRSEADRTGHWGDLPARLREEILHGKRDIDQYPPEFQEMIKEYMREIQRQGRDK